MAAAGTPKSTRQPPRRPETSPPVEPARETASSSGAPVPGETPGIDWQKEAELAGHDAIANAERESSYRDLSALSPAQLAWLRQNQLQPQSPGIPWKYRRVEITEGGFPIIHINDHCVVVPFLMMMVFCKIGHIEPNGDLFKHMRDARDP